MTNVDVVGIDGWYQSVLVGFLVPRLNLLQQARVRLGVFDVAAEVGHRLASNGLVGLGVLQVVVHPPVCLN